MKVFIENEAGSNQKNLYNEKNLEYIKTVEVSRKYPYPYGFILETTSGDGDNLDCFILTEKKLKTGSIVECEPVGLMEQFEDGKEDHNVLATLENESTEVGDNIKEKLTEFVSHVFDHRKGKIVKVGNFYGKEKAEEYINKCKDETINSNLFRTEKERKVTLTQKEQEKILGIDPSFQSISNAVYFDNYDLPCPVRVSVTTKDNKVITIVLRKNRHGDVRKEIQILRALKEFGLPVPEILAEPFEVEDDEYAAIYSLLPGENIQKLSMRSEKDLMLAKELLVQAIIQLMGATDFIKKHDVSKSLPSITLTDELDTLNTKDNLWLGEKIYLDAIQKIQKILPNIETPLVLSNDDYQPGNFLVQDGIIVGFLDFESPSFQDPMMGFVKYPIYDLLPLARTDLVKTFLDKKGFSEKDFNYRLALGCLKILKKEIPVSEGDEETQEYRNRVLDILSRSLTF